MTIIQLYYEEWIAYNHLTVMVTKKLFTILEVRNHMSERGSATRSITIDFNNYAFQSYTD